MVSVSLAQVFISEFVATGALLALGVGANANASLKGTAGYRGGNLMVILAWGLAVCFAAFLGFRSGAHLNPAVTLGFALTSDDFAPGVPVTWPAAACYVTAQFLGAFVGAVIGYLAYKPYFDISSEPESSVSIFATAPRIRAMGWAFVSEAIATAFLMLWLIGSSYTTHQLGPLAVALAIIVIGLGFGGTTGWAINPARDIGPRFAHWILPIPNKGSSDWKYAWVPTLAPLVGAAVGVGVARFLGVA